METKIDYPIERAKMLLDMIEEWILKHQKSGVVISRVVSDLARIFARAVTNGYEKETRRCFICNALNCSNCGNK